MKKLLLMAAVAFAMASCEKETKDCPSATEKTFALTGFTRIKTGENFTVRVIQGGSYSVKAKGCPNDLDDLSLSVDPVSGFLDIHYKQYKKGRYKAEFDIMLPALKTFSLGGAAKATITGFGSQTNSLLNILSGTAEVTVDQLPPKIDADLSGSSVLNLIGTTTAIKANVSGTSKVQAYTSTATEVDVSTSGAAKAYVVPQQKFTALATGTSRIYYKGNAAEKNIEQSGEGRVIKE